MLLIFYRSVIHYWSMVPKIIGSLLFPLKAYTSYQVHLPSMFPLFPENQKSVPYFLSGKILLKNVTLHIENFIWEIFPVWWHVNFESVFFAINIMKTHTKKTDSKYGDNFYCLIQFLLIKEFARYVLDSKTSIIFISDCPVYSELRNLNIKKS